MFGGFSCVYPTRYKYWKKSATIRQNTMWGNNPLINLQLSQWILWRDLGDYLKHSLNKRKPLFSMINSINGREEERQIPDNPATILGSFWFKCSWEIFLGCLFKMYKEDTLKKNITVINTINRRKILLDFRDSFKTCLIHIT